MVSAAAFASEVARRKALCLIDKYPDDVILTADTIVYRQKQLFLKPETMEEAHAMLRELAGKEHQVFTGVCVAKKNDCFIDAEETRVFFHELSEPQIRAYHNHFLPLDKAGGYAIRRDLSFLYRFLFWALLALIIAGFVLIFVHIPAAYTAYSIIGLVISFRISGRTHVGPGTKKVALVMRGESARRADA